MKNKKYFLQFSFRVWDPEESCWEEDPDYFNDIAWPEYRYLR